MKGIILTLTMAMSVVGWEPVDAPIGNDRAIVAAVIIAEGGGESKRGMCAIYEVIHTRASHKGTSCATEVMRRKQFKWVYDELLKFVPLTMFTVQENTHKLNRNRADHYYAHKKIAKPYWVGALEGKVIGNHKFYKLVK